MLPEAITVYGLPVRLFPWQRQAGPGSHYVIHVPDMACIVYGVILDAPTKKLEMSFIRNPGFFWCKAHSIYEPDGEQGEVHIFDIHGLISPDTFAAARDQGWPASGEAFAALVAGDPLWTQSRPAQVG